MTINFNDVWEDDRADQEEGGELEGKDHLVISSYNDNKYNYNIIIIVINANREEGGEQEGGQIMVYMLTRN